ncbi:MAG: glycoside hydrolase family 3 protein [Ruminococcaceae bacterium]|nr:glycoside hydrolase family 3 protein [Oscillospiraceae bacterium]
MKKIAVFFLSVLMGLTTVACKKEATPAPTVTPSVSLEEIGKIYETDPNGAAWTMLESMTLDEKIYQLMVVAPEALGDGGIVTGMTDAVKTGLSGYPVGGVVLFGDNIQSREQVTRLLTDLQGASRIPLFIAVDEEGGEVSRLSGIEGMGVSAVPSMREVGDGGDSQRAYDIGKNLGTEIGTLGFNVNFAPVADTLVNEENTEIGTRSFGTDPALVSAMVEEMVQGLRDSGVASAVKHFPGHGSALTDSHSGRARSERTYEEMQTADLLPFKAGIEAGADFVMISHMVNKDITKTDMECSMSTNVMTNILRNTMGFPNIIITDSLSMKAITDFYSPGAAALTAFEAGADMLLMPENIAEAHQAIKAAVENGRVSEMRLNESVSRILKVKLERGII